MPLKSRSTFWVVSTHVLTSGFAIPVATGLVVGGIARAANVGPPFSVVAQLIISTTTTLIGTGGGVFYSLAYLKWRAQFDNWSQCAKPSVIAYVLLAVLGFGLGVWQPEGRTPEALGIGLLNTVIGITLFAWLTISGFQRMSRAPLTAEELLELASPETVSSPRKIHPRLLSSGIGFVIGFVVGVGIAVFGLGGGGGPSLDWEMILVVGPFVGAIGALLGAASGPVRGI